MGKSIAGRTIMIVDDSSFVRTVLRDLLETQGVNVILEAENGVEAINGYQLHHPEVTIVDIHMPGINGLETAKEILLVDKDAKILICSGSWYESEINEALTMGIKGVIQKPFNLEGLATSINNAIDSK
ncbi:MAG: response regulator [Geobacter sp.]|nr:MAG: response regulator [Geobacter sp.]